ncbi:hypothetical protein ABIE38_001650 [Dietzia sp. 2505]|uniref:hypothetical protein n=1 Tax=Dietzia sp. 2505 TaxID=3156457 RepID=UPI0033967B57
MGAITAVGLAFNYGIDVVNGPWFHFLRLVAAVNTPRQHLSGHPGRASPNWAPLGGHGWRAATMSGDFTVRDLRALEVLDSRRDPNPRVEVRLGSGATGWAGVPSGVPLRIAAIQPHLPYGLSGAER